MLSVQAGKEGSMQNSLHKTEQERRLDGEAVGCHYISVCVDALSDSHQHNSILLANISISHRNYIEKRSLDRLQQIVYEFITEQQFSLKTGMLPAVVSCSLVNKQTKPCLSHYSGLLTWLQVLAFYRVQRNGNLQCLKGENKI